MRRAAAFVAISIVVALAAVLDADGQRRGRVAPAPGFTLGGTIRQVPVDDPAHARTLFRIRHEPKREAEGRAGWWPWYPAVPLVPVGPDLIAGAIPPDAGPAGGLQIDVQPGRAQVFVDGVYEGRAEEFRGYYHHLALSPGLHVIALVAEDHEPLVLEILVSPGQTMTYRGTLTYVSR